MQRIGRPYFVGVIPFIFVLTVAATVFGCLQCLDASGSSSVKIYDDAGGSGAVPYNYRVIDAKLHAGGNLFNPVTHSNSVKKVEEYLSFLTSQGVGHLVFLHVPDGGSDEIDVIAGLCEKYGIRTHRCRMTADEIPDDERTTWLMSLIDEGAYVHCMWGADRTGAVIARYLRLKKGYSGHESWKAVIGGGSHAGKMGGFKKTPGNKKLVLFFWPEVIAENPEIANIYDLR